MSLFDRDDYQSQVHAGWWERQFSKQPKPSERNEVMTYSTATSFEQDAFADHLRERVSPTLADWALNEFAVGQTLDDVHDTIRAAAAAVEEARAA